MAKALMFEALLEPISRYVEAAAHLAVIQATAPRDRQRIAEAGRDANRALQQLQMTLIETDQALVERETATFDAVKRSIRNDR